MNTGQRLATLSGLAGVSALAHFAALQAGGSGVGQTVFADRFTLLVEEPQLVLTRKLVKQAAPVERKPVAGVERATQSKPPFLCVEAPQHYVRASTLTVFAASHTEEFFVCERAALQAAVRRKDARVFVGDDNKLATLQE